MSLTVPLPPDLAARLTAEAARLGVPPVTLAAGVLDAHLPADRRAAALALLDAWHDGEEGDDQREAGEALVGGLDEGRPGQRPHFPPELEGVSW
jgi:hypothetical protein